MLSSKQKCSSAVLLLLAILPLRAQDNLTARRPFGQHTTAFTATPVFDAGITDNWKMTLTGNVTSSTLVSPEAGHTYTWEICQDATGSRTFAWPSQLSAPITIASTANACTTEIFYFDGTNGVIPTTTTGGGGGSGTVNGGTVNRLALYSGATTVSSNGHLDDGLTTANTLTYDDTGGIAAKTFKVTGTGAMTLPGVEGTCSGATALSDIVCIGDLTSHAAQISNNGDSFRPIATHESTSPVVGGVMVASSFPRMIAAPRGTPGQPFLETSGSAGGGFGQLDLSISTNVINRLAKANQTASTVYNDQVNTFTPAGTVDLSSSTVSNAFRTPNVAGISTTGNGALGYDPTSNNLHAGINGADARVPVWTGSAPTHHNCVWWTNVSGHVELGDSTTTCGGGSTPRLDQVTSATTSWTTTNGDNPLSLQFAATTSGRTSVELTESAAGTSGGTPFLFNAHTLAASTLNPCQFTARGTANGIRCDSVTGTLSAIGSANINSTQINGVSVTGTPQVGQIPIATSSSASSWGDPITSGNQPAATTQTITATGALTGVTITNIGTALVTISGTYAGVAFNFEATPDGTFAPAFPVNASQLDASSIVSASGTLSSNTTRSWLVDVAGFTKLRLNATAYTSGTANITITPVYHQFLPWTNANLTAGSNIVGKVGIDQTTPGTTNAMAATNLPTTVDTNSGNKSASTLRFVLATDQPQMTNPQLAVPEPSTASGDAVSACNILSAASTNSTNCKGSAGNFYGYEIYNTTTTIYYLRLYNASSAPTCSSATGFIRSIPVPPAGASGQAGGAISNQNFPVNFGTGIGYCITGGSSSTDNTNAATGIFGEIRYR